MTYAWDNDSTQNAHIKQMRDDRQKAYMEKHRDNKAYERFKHMPDYGKGAVMERLTNRDYGENSCAVYTSYCDACHNSDCHCGLVEDMIEKLADYEDLEEQGRLIKLPCKVGDTVYVDNTILPIEDMECYEDIDNKIPLYFPARVVSFRFAKRNWMKIAVKAKWLHEWIDDETGPESDYIECEKNFTILLSMIGKTVFLTKSEVEEKLKELRGGEDGSME